MSIRVPISQQKGQALLVMLITLIFGVAGVIFSAARSNVYSIEIDDETLRALHSARAALIGWSASRDATIAEPDARPGELPCPDTDNDGLSESNCSINQIGRIPWKTLGIPEPKDRFGETLWYMVTDAFRPRISNNFPITSNTVGEIEVYSLKNLSQTTQLTSQAIAVIIAPGAPLGNQVRGNDAERNDPNNYLDNHSATSINHATSAEFLIAPADNRFNDKLIFLSNEDLMPAVEQAVARKIIGYLQAYRNATGFYPWADLADGISNASAGPPPNFYNKNRFPCQAALPFNWGNTAPFIPELPSWLTHGCWSTGWTSLIYYAVATNRLEGNGANCTTCGGSTTLTLIGSGQATVCQNATQTCSLEYISGGTADLVLLTPGARVGTPFQNWPNTAFSLSTGYFEDFENRDNLNNTFAIPSSQNLNRDRIHIVR